jgi:hypothetical protein
LVLIAAPEEDSLALGVNGNESNNSANASGAAYVFPVPLGTATTVGLGYGSAAPLPALALSSSRLGQLVTLLVSNAQPSAPGIIYIGTLSPIPFTYATGCDVYLDIPTAQVFIPFATNSLGSWSIPFYLPHDPALAGLHFSLQAAVFPSNSPIGLDSTNALDVTLGY